jgi:hypothetical protein
VQFKQGSGVITSVPSPWVSSLYQHSTKNKMLLVPFFTLISGLIFSSVAISDKIHQWEFSRISLFDTVCIGCSFKFPVKAGVEKSIVNALRITIKDQPFKSYAFTRMVRSQSNLQRQL